MINVDELCVLKLENNRLIMIYEPIEDHFKKERNNFKELCESGQENIGEIIKFIGQTESLRKLQRKYNYCGDLDSPSKTIHVDFKSIINRLNIERQNLISKLKADNTVYNEKKFHSDISRLKKGLLDEFETWLSAFNIMRTYDKCKLDKNIIAYSHRKRGWLTYSYRLSDNLSLEIKTNFGFGNASYFYVLLKYKKLVVSTYSDWISYHKAKYSDIIRYTVSFTVKRTKKFGKKTGTHTTIEDDYWKKVMEYSVKAHNLSLTDEESFLDEYIMKECKKMVNGLETLYNKKITKEQLELDKDKNGYKLMEYKAEKISGALDFINHILEFQSDVDISQSVLDIENINKKLQPLLSKEVFKIEKKLKSLYPAHLELERKYSNYVEKRQEYMKIKNKIRREVKNAVVKVDDRSEEVERRFKVQFPEFKIFNEELERLTEPWEKSKNEIATLEIPLKNISLYNDKILDYFNKESIF